MIQKREGDDDRQNDLGLVMVALEKRSIEPGVIVKVLSDGFGIEAKVAKKGEPCVIELEDSEAYVTTLPLPLAAKDREAAVERSWHWKGAAAALAGHTAHAVVTVASPKGTSRLEQALRLTRVVAAVAAASGAPAIYWQSAGLLHDPNELFEEITNAGADYVPVMLWVSLVPFQVKKRKHLTTQGLAELGSLEIELDAEGPIADRIVELLPDLMASALLAGQTFQDGDTFGLDDGQEFVLRERKSLRGEGRVLHVAPGG